MKTRQRFCKSCERNVMGQKETANHILHLLLSIITGGLWIPIWILCSIRIGGWKCSYCGSSTSAAGFDKFAELFIGFSAIIFFLFILVGVFSSY